MRPRPFLMAFALACFFTESQTAWGGSYLHTAVCSATAGCVVGHPLSSPSNNVNPQSIVHPVTFVQNGTSFTVSICTNSTPSTGIPQALQYAVDKWNAGIRRTQNCYRCGTWETGTPPGNAGLMPVMATTLLHELGHCALGLDHPELNWDANGNPSDGKEPTSYTRSWNASQVLIGGDFIRGSSDDRQDAIGGQLAESVSWFRRTDNDPVIVDPTTIDVNTYSRSVSANLPPGDTWAANANLRVAEQRSQSGTQAIMYGGIADGSFYSGLSADDVNMLEMARTGPDVTANTSDDYTLQLNVVPCASPRQVDVHFLPLGVGVLGECHARVDYAYSQNPALARVFKVVPDPQHNATHVQIILNSNEAWNTSIPVFGDGFDGGTTAAWSLTVP